MYATGWAAIVGLALFGPPLLVTIAAENGWIQAGLALTWVGSAIAGVMAGKSNETNGRQPSKVLEWIAMSTPYVFMAGLLLLLSLLAAVATLDNWPDPTKLDLYFKELNDTTCWRVFGWLVFCLILSFVMAWRTDVNIFSLHGLYANRLVRCYLGASRPKIQNPDFRDMPGGAPVSVVGPERRPNPITGFDPNDDLWLCKLCINPTPAASPDESPPDLPYQCPFLLINTAMNLVGGDELAWQERMAESFVLTALHCGSKSTGFRRLSERDDAPLLLGTALTLSGAALSPNMGYHSSPAVTALLTVFNVRLGGWVANPRYKVPSNTGPPLGLWYLLSELFGRTNARSQYVYLSDGGHFENLGVYELVRRRCRLVVVCDASADPAGKFEDLGNLIRKCRTDFGVRITIDISSLQKETGSSLSKSHSAIGKIHYGEVDPGAQDGILVYIKASLTTDVPSDVLQFHKQHPEFPHDPTADQFFNESKFESYRELGYHIAKKVFGDAGEKTDCPDEKLLHDRIEELRKKFGLTKGLTRVDPDYL